jgi:Fibronectin type III domain
MDPGNSTGSTTLGETMNKKMTAPCNDTRQTKKGGNMNGLIKRTMATFSALSMITIGLMLSGCGGSGGGLSSQVVSGTAATGAPLTGQVTLKDASPTPQTKTTVIGSDGTFAIDVTGLQAPYILQATGNVNGVGVSLHSFADGAGTANINPLSDVIVASAAGDADASQTYNQANSAKLHTVSANLAAAEAALMAELKPLLQLYNAQNVNPITSHYTANHLGLDGMLDNVTITVANGMVSIVNTKNTAMIFSSQVTAIASGTFNMGAMPSAPAVPAAPAGMTATGGAGQIALSWSPVSGATAYNIYYASTSGVTTATGTKVTSATSSYILGGLAASTTCYYVVTAVNSAGESAASAEVSATTNASVPTPTAPVAPTGVTATGGVSQVSLSWAAVSGATSYNLYYSTVSGVTTANGTKVSGVTSPYVQTGLAAGTTYFYVVTAVNGAGEGAASAQASAATTASAPAFDALSYYNSVCLGCHGTLGVRSVAQITSAIAGFSAMKSLSTLTAAQIAAIAAVSH